MSETRECAVCWWVYDPALGDEDAAVPPGTPFEALPAEWRCPRCDAPRARFVRPRAEEEPPIEARVEALTLAYERILATRMAGLPIQNPRLRVEAVSFQPWGPGLFGVLVTPWSINAVILGDPDAEVPLHGHERELPSGRYTFFPQRLEGVGTIEIASLISPVLEMEDQAAAVATARAAAALMLAPPEAQAPPARTRRELFGFLRGRGDRDRDRDRGPA